MEKSRCFRLEKGNFSKFPSIVTFTDGIQQVVLEEIDFDFRKKTSKASSFWILSSTKFQPIEPNGHWNSFPYETWQMGPWSNKFTKSFRIFRDFNVDKCQNFALFGPHDHWKLWYANKSFNKTLHRNFFPTRFILANNSMTKSNQNSRFSKPLGTSTIQVFESSGKTKNSLINSLFLVGVCWFRTTGATKRFERNWISISGFSYTSNTEQKTVRKIYCKQKSVAADKDGNILCCGSEHNWDWKSKRKTIVCNLWQSQAFSYSMPASKQKSTLKIFL